MNLVDSSGWIEYLADTKYAKHFVPAIENTNKLIVSTLNIYEVYKKVLKEKNEDTAMQVASIMQQAKVIDVTPVISIQAAKLSLDRNIPMADSIIYISARQLNAIVWTMDTDFLHLEGVNFFSK
jgi:toxin FitB